MITRISGGSSGIKDYLENGQKQDRYYSRDELDHRLILAGDLDIVDNLIQTMDKNEVERDRYFHITLAFKEDTISEQMLSDISNEFRQFYFKAYGDDEIHYYAEAHLPKIKSYLDASTGEAIERKPHIHIVVPKINTLNSLSLNIDTPSIINYIDAFQEHINSKYGLASPKDNPRYKVNDNSEFISRYKGDGFKGKHHEVREKIFDEIIAKNISSFSELQKHLQSEGYTTKIRNEGKGADKEYINILDINGVSINLRDKVFQEQFLKLESNDKITKLKSDVSYIEPSSSTTTENKYQELLKEWEDFKAYEYKYVIASTSKQERERFNKLSLTDKKEYIRLKQVEFKDKYSGVEYDGTRTNPGEYREHEPVGIEQAYLDSIANNIRTADETLENIGDNLGRSVPNKASSIGRERRGRIASRYARIIGRSENSSGRDISQYQSNKYGTGANNQEIRKYNYIDNEYENTLAKLKLNQTQFKELVTKYNTEIQSDVLLELLEKTHGVNPEIYRITKATDGSDRIGCGVRNLNMMDFCVKEMNLSLEETNNILSNALNMQMDINRERGWSRESAVYLSQEYKEWFKGYKAERAESIFKHKDTFKTKRLELIESFKDKTAKTNANETLTYRAKREQLNLLKIDKILELEALNKAKYAEDISLKNRYNLEMQKAYRTFLIERANDNDERALLELRRLRIDFQNVQKSDSFNYVDRYQEYKLNITHKIDQNGVINYIHNGNTIVQDHGKRVSIVKHTDENVKLILDLAMQKFGMNIALTGSEKFRQRAVDMAIKSNYKINFIDEFSKKYYNEKMNEYKANNERLASSKGEVLTDMPKALYVGAVKQRTVVNHNGRCSTLNTVELIDPATNKTYEVSGHKINFMAKNLIPGQFVEVSLDKTNDLIIKASGVDKEIRKIKENIIKQEQKNFYTQVLTDYGVKELKQGYSGKLIGTGEVRGKFYALVVVNGEAKRIWNNELKNKFEELNIKKGDVISIAVPDTKQVQITNKENTIDIKRADKIFDDILLESDLLAGNQVYKKEYFGRVTEVKPVILKSGRSTNIVTINDNLSGKVQTVYMDDTGKLKPNDFTKLGEKSFNSYDVAILNDRLQAKREQVLGEQNTKDVSLGEIAKIGLKDIKGNEVYFVELRTDTGIVTKYGNKIRQEIEQAGLKVGDGIVLTNKESIIITTIEENIIEVKQLDQGIEEKAEIEIERILDNIELEQNIQIVQENKLDKDFEI